MHNDIIIVLCETDALLWRPNINDIILFSYMYCINDFLWHYVIFLYIISPFSFIHFLVKVIQNKFAFPIKYHRIQYFTHFYLIYCHLEWKFYWEKNQDKILTSQIKNQLISAVCLHFFKDIINWHLLWLYSENYKTGKRKLFFVYIFEL